MSYIVKIEESDAISDLPLYICITKLNIALLTYKPSEACIFRDEEQAVDTYRLYVEDNWEYYSHLNVTLDARILRRTFI
tara:strand:- start:37175 stop:37411 length:237 start_codon:yes stop_codon:yes gene_type:complete